MTKSSLDIHQHVTDQIIALIEAGVGESRMPWQRVGIGNLMPANANTQATYRGINILSLWASALTHDYPRGLWASYRQWSELGAQVRKGETGSLVVFYRQYDVEPDPANDTDDGHRRVARASWVFNCAQVDGFTLPDMPERPPVERIGRAEALIAATGAVIRHGGDRAYYRPSQDIIQMPDERLFDAEDAVQRSEDHLAVLLHELTHWSGVKSRLNRDLGSRFGDPNYALEELIAELGACFLLADLDICARPRVDHVCYIANWLQALKQDKRAIFTAAARASEAAKYLAAFSQPANA